MRPATGFLSERKRALRVVFFLYVYAPSEKRMEVIALFAPLYIYLVLPIFRKRHTKNHSIPSSGKIRLARCT